MQIRFFTRLAALCIGNLILYALVRMLPAIVNNEYGYLEILYWIFLFTFLLGQFIEVSGFLSGPSGAIKKSIPSQEIKQRIMKEDPNYFSLLCGCHTEYIVHGDAKDKRHIVSCQCGVFVIEPNYNAEAGMYLPYLKLIASK